MGTRGGSLWESEEGHYGNQRRVTMGIRGGSLWESEEGHYGNQRRVTMGIRGGSLWESEEGHYGNQRRVTMGIRGGSLWESEEGHYGNQRRVIRVSYRIFGLGGSTKCGIGGIPLPEFFFEIWPHLTIDFSISNNNNKYSQTLGGAPVSHTGLENIWG